MQKRGLFLLRRMRGTETSVDTEMQSERRMKLCTDEGAKGEQNKASVALQSITLSPGEGRLRFLHQHIKTFQGRYGVSIQRIHSWRWVLLEEARAFAAER